MQDYIIANGETLSNQNFGYGDTILVQTGGTLNGAVIPYNVSSVTLEAGAALSGTIRTAKEITLSGSGSVDASGADLILDISDRKPENDLGIMISDWTLLTPNSLSLVVSLDQDKGTYRLVGNAADFNGTISIMDSFGESLGSLSVGDSGLDYEFAHYALSLNESDELCLTVSSNLPDPTTNVLLYQGDIMQTYSAANPPPASLTISSADSANGDTLYVFKGGSVSDVTLGEGGTLYYYSGATVTDLVLELAETDHDKDPVFHATFDGNEETGLLTGSHKHGAFSYQAETALDPATLTNMAILEGSSVLIKNNVLVRNLYISSRLPNQESGIVLESGSTVTGIIHEYEAGHWGGGEIKLQAYDSYFENLNIYKAEYQDMQFIAERCSLDHVNVIPNSGDTREFEFRLFNGTASDSSFDHLTIVGSDFGNVTAKTLEIDGGYRVSTLTGDIVVSRKLEVNCEFDADGHTITLDMIKRKITDGFFVNSFEQLHNSNLIIAVSNLGYFKLAERGEHFGQENSGDVIGDLDGVIDICDANGVYLCGCAVNGETQYIGRYNYTITLDEVSGEMYLNVGWNGRDEREFAADVYDTDGNNDTAATATVISGSNIGVIEDLTIHSVSRETPADEDWFQFTLSSPGTKSNYIGIDFKQVIGDLDLELYAADGTTRLDYARSVTDNERISLEGLGTGTYYVRVYGHSGSVNQYSLVYDLPAAYVWTDDDQYEDNDNKAHSYHLGKITDARSIQAAIATPESHGASYHNNVVTVDEDYFMFQLPKNGKNNDMITLTCDGSMGDLDLYLYGSNGTLLVASSQNTSGGFEQISLSGLKHGVYYVAVKGKTGGVDVGNYELSFSGSEQVLTPDADESNNTFDTAKNLFTLNGTGSREELSIHSVFDEDYYRFSVKETGSADDWIGIEHDATLGDLDVELYDRDGNLVGASRTAENTDRISLNGLAVGDYYIRVYGNSSTNAYSLNWNITNSSLIAADSYEGMEPIEIRQDQKIEKLSIAVEREDDETRADTFEITLQATGTSDTKIILTDYRSDWADGMSYTLKDSNETIILSGTGSEISLDGCAAGTYTLTVDTPVEDQYTTYSVIAQGLPEEAESVPSAENKWSVFVYMTADNNLIGSYTEELFFMQRAVLQEGVDVYLLLDGPGGNDTRVGKLRHNLGRGYSIEWEELGEQSEWNTGVATTFEAFLDWGLTQAPTGNIALIMKDHGSSLGYNSLDYNGLFKSKNSSVMSISDVAEVLDKQKYDRISVAAFDQCLMGSDVVVATMDGVVDYVVASEANGFTPNQLVVYTKLFESISSDMTSQEVAQKIVDSCNKTSPLPMTLASFHTTGTLSAALEAFGTASAGFTATDWTAICKSFALAHNYGDSICAYSDLGFLLASIKSTRLSISDGLNNAIDALSNALNLVVDSTTMKPESYGSGIAVFNPVLSSRDMSCYTYAPGAKLDYYANIPSSIDAWGDFLATVSEKSRTGLFSGFFSGLVRDLVFTDYSYCLAMPLTAEPGEEASLQIANDLGAFFGNGVEYKGLYLDANGKAYFTISLDEAGIAGDTISVRADNQNANLTVKLVKTTYSDDVDTSPVTTIVATSVNGVLSLAGIASNRTGDQTEYDLIIETDAETSYDLTFGATWSSGSDYFDYKQSGHLGGQGNGTIEKATVLAAGNYGGLVTHSTDADYYRLKTIFTDTLNVTVEGGAGLDVASYDADGSRIDTASYANGKYTIVVANEGYLYVKGSTELLENGKAVDSYSLFIRDVEEEYLEGGLDLDISGMSTNSTPIIEDLSSIDDWEEIDFKVTVDASQAAGTYVLAGGAAGFNRTITVQTADNELGTLTVGGQLFSSDARYSLTLTDGNLSLTKEVFSGSFMSGAKPLNGVATDIQGVYFKYNVMGGLNYSGSISETDHVETGNISLTIGNGSTFNANLCADRINSGSLRRTGNVDITINGGEFNGFVIGGQHLNVANPKTNPSTLLSRAILIGDVNMTISGGSFTGSAIYGGSYCSYKVCSGNSMITGNVTTTFRAEDDQTISVSGHYFAGSYNHGIIGGNVTTVISGGGTVSIGGEIWGGCGGDYYTVGATRTFETTILGDRLLSFTGFTGELTAQKIRGYNSIEFIKDDAGDKTSFAFTDSGYNFSDIANWTFEYGCDASGNFTNNFAGDTLNLTGLDSWDGESDWTILTNTNAKGFLGFCGSEIGKDTFASVTLGGQAASLADGCWVSDSYRLYLSGNSMMLAQI